MKTFHIFFLLILLTLSIEVAAESNLKFSVKPTISRGFGHTTYTMDSPVVDSNGVIVSRAKSELVFPVDALYIGGEFGIEAYSAGRKDWFASVAAQTNIGDPSGKMTDTDWAGYIYYKWSYTESEPDMDYFQFSVKAGKYIYGWDKANSYAFFGYRYQRIVQDIDNFSGWQIDITDPDLPKDTVDMTVHALYYKATYHMPMAGLYYNIQFNNKSSFDITAAYMHVFASDFDDHILRKKTAISDGTGPGFYGNVKYHRIFPMKNNRMHWFVDFDGDLTTLKVTTSQTQEWYGDDQISPGDDTGSIVDNIPHDFTSLQFYIRLSIGIGF